MIRKCLIIDNEDQSSTIEKAERLAKQKGLNIEFKQFNVGNTENTEFLTEGAINIPKVVDEYKKEYENETFHLAIFDWNLDDDAINGIELVRQLEANNILKNTPKIVVSAKLKIILNEIAVAEESKRIERLSVLVRSGIKDYIDRDNYEVDIIKFFKKNEDSLDLNIEEVLKKFPTLKFEQNFINKKFNGKTFLEIANYLSNNEMIRNDFKKEIIQQVIAYLTEKM
jgi:CheY-like chemotaxis protein